jgi:hypothetical protein
MHAKGATLIKIIFSVPKCITVVELYMETKSFKEMSIVFVEKYVNSSVPSKCCIKNLMKRCREMGCVADKEHVRQQPFQNLQLLATV